ncbi:hypothetical protein ABGB17_32885 [Sphaerisporangium sp. B11E5]|uniref:hypothetical protein n=1 Tax=Sphaerisporangium sp. B11E5 TaxID=3153563 RepID=UPI00325CDCE6
MKVIARFTRTPAGRLASVLLVAGAGLLIAGYGDAPAVATGSWYMWGVGALLAVGLYGSASGIPREAVRDWRVVLAAVTVGVLLKTALIAAVMYAAAGLGPAAMLLGVAVAQIDPLSVAAITGSSRMSRRAKALLSAWASFDDPVTALLTVYLISFAVGGAGPVGGLSGYATGLALNAVFAAVVFALWALARSYVPDRPGPGGEPRPPLWFGVAAGVVLLGLVAVAATWYLMLGIALIGLFYRPGIDAVTERVTQAAFYAATFVLGLLLAGGVHIGLGVLLGVSAFAAQIVAGLLIAHRLPVTDRVHLALGQQNGITAVILALTLQPYLPYAVGVVAPAILTVNVLHLLSNSAWDAVLRGRRPAPPPWVRPAPARLARPAAPRPARPARLPTRPLRPAPLSKD